MNGTGSMHYFQIRLNEPISCAPYQPLRISQAGATSLLFLPFGEHTVTLAGSPSEYEFDEVSLTVSVPSFARMASSPTIEENFTL